MNVLMDIVVVAMQLFSLGILGYGMVLALRSGFERALEDIRTPFGHDVVISHLAAT